jgi:hypothetical protein
MLDTLRVACNESSTGNDNQNSYHDFSNMNSGTILEALRSLEVPVLIDLNGHTKGAQPALTYLLQLESRQQCGSGSSREQFGDSASTSGRTGVILANFLGFPSVTGGLHDYFITDSLTTPPGTVIFICSTARYMPLSCRHLTRFLPSLISALILQNCTR